MTLNEEFVNGPVAFFKKYGVNAGAFETGVGEFVSGKKRSKTLYQSDALDSGTWGSGAKGMGVKWMNMGDRNVGKFSFKLAETGAAQLQADPTNDDALDMYYLPWNPMKVLSLHIPANSKAKYFVTAALSGCSIFVRGSTQEPYIYHCGRSSGGGVDDVTSYYKDWVKKAATDEGGILWNLCEVNKFDYCTQRNIVTTFGNWMKDEWLPTSQSRPFKLEYVTPLGCVFGFQDDTGRWSFYLQERIRVSVSILEKTQRSASSGHKLPGGRSFLEKTEEITQTTKHKLFGKTLFTKKRTVGVREHYSRVYPSTVKQFFPKGGSQVSLLPRIKTGSL
jgi:hypothetical protein